MTGKNTSTLNANGKSKDPSPNSNGNGPGPRPGGTNKSPTTPAAPTRKPRQIRTELDRLLMDEGTVNMLCDTHPSSTSSSPGRGHFLNGIGGPSSKGYKNPSGGRGFGSHSYQYQPSKKAKLEALRLRRLAVLSSVRNRCGIENAGKNLREKKLRVPAAGENSSSNATSGSGLPRRRRSEDPDLPLRSSAGTRGSSATTAPGSWFNKGRRASLLATLKEDHRPGGDGDSDGKKLDFIPGPGAEKRILSTITPDGLGHVTISYLPNGKWTVDLQALKDLSSTLRHLDAEPRVKLILISSSGAKFCNGVDLREFYGASDKKNIAEEMANAIWNYLKTVASLRKLSIISLHSSVSNLFVTSLPLYDLVYASDKSTFRCNYLNLGQVPEGGRLLFERIGKAAFNNLVYGRREFTASEAKDCGLVNEVLWPARFHQEVIIRVRHLLNWKANTLSLTKSSLPQPSSLSEENQGIEKRNLISCWTSESFHQAVKSFLSERELKI